jgi:MSHA biogenesis protein MshM
MYLTHFGLKQLPFTLTPNTDFYLGLAQHDEALAVLLTALSTDEGFIKVIGEVGTGKTLLCRKLLNEIPDNFVTAYIPNPFLNPDELRCALAIELGVEQAQQMSLLLLTEHIHKRLLDLHGQGKSVALILDEAQALPAESLEALRLFTNLETETRKLLQVVLFAQPELDERLNQVAFRQLRQRISFSYQLRPMSAAQVEHYITCRLQIAGYHGVALFSKRLTKKIARASQGIPRLVNILCHKMLMLSYGKGHYQISRQDFTLAVKDTHDARRRPLFYYIIAAASTLIGLTSAWLYISWGMQA